MGRYRTHTCNELGKAHHEAQVVLSGFVSAMREHGGMTFIDLRDWYGITQLVFQKPETPEVALSAAGQLSLESAIRIEGQVRIRPAGMENPGLETGQIEVLVKVLEVLSPVLEPMPFLVAKESEVNEAARLKYRFLDLRRPKMRRNLAERSRLIQRLRECCLGHGFYEIHTPILTNSSPEGARDWLVPSRLYPGKFFALPQAPQQWKQLLMASGVDRYFQIAPCFRDEPARADRSPGEFYQLDLEMAFVEQDDVLREVESILLQLVAYYPEKKVARPWPRFTYHEVLERFGSDKPDLRFGLELRTLTEHFRDSAVGFLQKGVQAGEVVRGLCVPEGAKIARRELDELDALAKQSGGKGLASLAWKKDSAGGSLAKAMPETEKNHLRQVFNAQIGDLVLLSVGPLRIVNTALNAVRNELGNRLGLRDDNILHFAWVVNFPMYERDLETGEIVFGHNPFSMPIGGLEALNTQEPLKIYSYQYDLICNGVEISSGAIRNNIPEALYRAFEIAGYTRETVDKQFGHMIRAFRYGTPPHGGMAPGVERLLMLLLNEKSIREVVPFPKNQQCQDLMVGAPSEVLPKQLDELCLRIVKKE